MIIELQKEVLPSDVQEKLGINGYRGSVSFDLTKFAPEIVDVVEKAILPLKGKKGITQALRTIKAFRNLQTLSPEESCMKAKLVEHYYPAFKRIMKELPSKRLYQLQRDGETARADAYYVEKMAFSVRERRVEGRGADRMVWVVPGRITLSLVYMTERGLARDSLTLTEDMLFGNHPLVALGKAGYVTETPELKAAMLAERERWESLRTAVGKQLDGVGMATAFTERGNDDDRWWRSTEKEVRLDKDGPAPLVVDVYSEGVADDDDGNSRQKSLKTFSAAFWEDSKALSDEEEALLAAAKSKNKNSADSDDEPDDADPFEDDDADEPEGATPTGNGLESGTLTNFGPLREVPCHPWLICFDLRKHHRVRVHMSQTTEHVYDTGMREKLVLEPQSRLLIEMLLHQRQQFQDVIKKKGGGAVILCAGMPGTGKTLSAEVFAEAEKRPLYSVQCSQLGTSADDLESSLLKIFARAQRWSAILLLDEADVYIAQRGNDMNQNAIVGVFLRVLEYYNGVMFMTTNRADSVDDAVLSRCVARIDYTNPAPAEQIRIWNILATAAGLKLAPGAPEAIAAKYSLSGRDVKQLLKLASLVAYGRRIEAIDVAAIEFSMRFKPAHRLNETKAPAAPPAGVHFGTK